MKRHLTLSPDPIDEAAFVAQRTLSPGMGAVVYFSGVVRAQEEDRTITAI